MTADEYYQRSTSRGEERATDGSYIHPSGLSNRVFRRLSQAGYTDGDGKWENRTLDWERVRKDVINGSIWNVRNLGKAGVVQICEVLAERDGKQ